MKKLGVLFAAVLMMLSFSTVNAQKIAHADVASILSAMPEMKKAQEQLTELSKVKQNELQKLQQALQEKVQKYQKEAKSQSPEANQQREAELRKETQHIQEMAQAADKDLMEKQNTLYTPIEKKLRDAINSVAKEKGFDYVFDSNAQALIYKNGTDITAAVKSKLGL